MIEPEGRNTAAAIALAALAIERRRRRRDGRAAGRSPHRPGPRGHLPRRARRRGERPRRRGVRRRSAARDAGHRADPPRDPVRLPRAVRGSRRADRGPPRLPARGVRGEARCRTAPATSFACRASPGTRGCSCGAGTRSAPRSRPGRRTWRLPSSRASRTGDVATAYDDDHSRCSIDYAVMEPAATAGRVVMASMDVGWTRPRGVVGAARGAGAAGIEAGVVEAGSRRRRPEPATSSSTGTIGALSCVRQRAGTMTSERPVALLRGARGAMPLVQALLDRCAAAEARA